MYVYIYIYIYIYISISIGWRRTRSGMALELWACESLSPSAEVRVSGKKNFSSTEKFCLLQTLARCLGGTGWIWNKLLAAWKVVDLESIYFHYTAASFYTNLTQPPAWIIKINFPALQKFYSMGPCHLHVRKLPILLNSQYATSLLTSLILSK